MSTSTMPDPGRERAEPAAPRAVVPGLVRRTRCYYEPVGRPADDRASTWSCRTSSQLLQGAGTLASPLHDVTFSGLQFSYATWNAPSSTAGFADVQSNLRMTGATNQGMCTFSDAGREPARGGR